MSVRDEIDKAIGAHGAWKQKLRAAIETGESESTPDKVKKDYNCSFGKWLHQRVESAERNSPYYAEVVELHANFHHEAGAILEFALKGDKVEAKNRMLLNSNFSKVSSRLTRTLKEWRTSL